MVQRSSIIKDSSPAEGQETANFEPEVVTGPKPEAARRKKSCAKLRARHWRGDRTVVTLALAATLILAIGSSRHVDQTGVGRSPSLVMKALWRDCADIVLAGDSRVHRALSPAAMQAYFPGLRILNYAFPGVAYADDYLSAVEGVLARDSTRKIVVLGICPRALTQGAARQSTFEEYTTKTKREKQMILRFGQLQYIFRPFRMRHNPRPSRRYRHYYRDGFAACYNVPEEPESVLRSYSRIFDPQDLGPVDPEITKQLLRAVTRWRGRGIEVYGFRPPTIPEMVAIENEHAKFDERLFAAQFEKAGGTWLTIEDENYVAGDACHLHPEGAVRVSREISERILGASATSRE